MNSWRQMAALAAIALASATSHAADGASVAGYGVKLGGYFTDQQEGAAKKAFAQYYAKSKACPKDMERKGKTCRALVQGHYWAVGQTLHKEVETFALPETVEASLPKVPDGYEYVRAGEDILLLSKGLHLVVDVMQDVAGDG